MKTTTVKILCMLLTLAILLFTFSACNSKQEDAPSSFEPASSDINSEEEPLSDETVENENSSQPEETVDDEEFYEEDDWTEDFEADEGVYYESLHVNNEKYVNDRFMGIGYIHQMFSYQNDKSGRVYNDSQRALELETMKKMNIKTIRSYYGADYSWDPITHTRNFESEEMLGFYKACRAMESIGVDVGVTAQWSLRHFLYDSTYNDDMSQFALSGLLSDDFDETCKNYREFMKQTVLALKAHGVNNVKYFFAYTECHNTFYDRKDINGNPTDTDHMNDDYEFEKLFPIYDKAITSLHNGLKDAGLRNQYKIVGPCDNWIYSWEEAGYSPLVKYTVDELSDVVDIIGSHNNYAEGRDLSDDVYYDIPQERQEPTYSAARAAGKDHWIDEFNIRALPNSSEATYAERITYADNPIRGVAAGAMINGVLNYGYADNIFIWTLYDEQWPDNMSGESGVGSEFDNGVHLCGYLPCLFETSRPYKPWYAMSLMSRYIGSGKIYECEIAYGLYISAIERDDGEITLLVTNYNMEDIPAEISFAKSVGGRDFYRYRYNNAEIKAAQGNEMIKADAVAENVTNKFYDTFPAYSVTVYSTQKN